MQFEPNNPIVELCTLGMSLEGEGKKQEALSIFKQAWNEATNNFEGYIAAHYVARHQESIEDKLNWDEIALHLALQIDSPDLKVSYPSLYLNLAKCYEDLGDFGNAKTNYQMALSFADFLPSNGYGKMIKSGIVSGLERIKI